MRTQFKELSIIPVATLALAITLPAKQLRLNRGLVRPARRRVAGKLVRHEVQRSTI